MFSNYLGTSLSRSHEMEDITADYPELNFDYIGIREKSATINLIGLVDADNLNEEEIIDKISMFYDYIAAFKKDLLFNRIYKPNGVICFVFEDEKCAYRLRKFIPKQSLIDHSQSKGRVVVPWLINVKEREIIPHKRMVDWMPPTRINYNPPLGVHPGLDAIDKLLRTYPGTHKHQEIHKDLRFYTDLDTLVTQTVELVSNGNIRLALVRVKNSIHVNSENHQTAVMLLSNFTRIRKEEHEDQIQTDVILNKITNRTLDFIKQLTKQDIKSH